jgi:hypothetical protein
METKDNVAAWPNRFFGVELIIQLPLSDAPLSWIGAAQLDEATGHENANNNSCLDTCASK